MRPKQPRTPSASFPLFPKTCPSPCSQSSFLKKPATKLDSTEPLTTLPAYSLMSKTPPTTKNHPAFHLSNGPTKKNAMNPLCFLFVRVSNHGFTIERAPGSIPKPAIPSCQTPPPLKNSESSMSLTRIIRRQSPTMLALSHSSIPPPKVSIGANSVRNSATFGASLMEMTLASVIFFWPPMTRSQTLQSPSKNATQPQKILSSSYFAKSLQE